MSESVGVIPSPKAEMFRPANLPPIEALQQAPIISEDTMTWQGISFEDRNFVFSDKLDVRVIHEEGGWAFESDELDMMGFGHSREEAELAFRHTFVACWDNYAKEDDAKLTPDAIELKQLLLALAKEV
jgi:hypothetical protein